MTGSTAEVEARLRRSVERAPTSLPAHADLAFLLCRLNRANEAIALLDDAIQDPARQLWALSLKTIILFGERRIEEAILVHQRLIARAPEAAVPWMNYAHALKAAGRLEDAVAAYRRSLEIDPANGFAWWGLASLRTVRLDHCDVSLLEQALRIPGDDLNRVLLHFALGKSLGDVNRFELSFDHYRQANEIRARLKPYHAIDDLVRRTEAMFTPDFFAARGNGPSAGSNVIFIVGMPRSGSTLIEQILASHPLVEGLGELFELQNIATRIAGSNPKKPWPEALADLTTDECRALGESYLNSTHRYRRTDKPFFTDKMPSNWQYLNLISMILPGARIIDVRRHAVACCFSNFTTYFNLQTNVPGSLEDFARHYRSYVRMIAHFNATLPARIYSIQYERAIEDTEGEVRRVLAHLDLPFDPDCLRFHENPRVVDTASSAQVRRPINRDGLGRWRRYEPWLAPLQNALGHLADTALPSHPGN